MATILAFLLFLSTFSTATAQPKHLNITIDSYISATTHSTSWSSPSGLFSFGFYREGAGFRVGIWLETSPNKTIVWTANQDDPPVSGNSTLVLMKKGFSLRTAGAQDKFFPSEFSSRYFLSSVSMLDSGNLVLYNSDYEIVWESFDHPTDTILGGQSLRTGNQLFSSASETDHSIGRFQLSMQSDGNLVLYPKNHTTSTSIDAYWAAATNQEESISLHLYPDGFMYLVNDTGYNKNFLKRGAVANNGTVIYRATIDVDGIFRLYSHRFTRNSISTTMIEVSVLSNKCQVKGVCGFNSYCRLVNDQPNCLCLPGYNFIDPDHKLEGCSRNFTMEGCIVKKEHFKYFISTVEDVVFRDDWYAALSITKDECGNACLNDCKCEATMFQDGKCKKLMLPLKYGRSDGSDSTSFIKMGNESPVDANTNSSPTATKMPAVEIKKEPRVKVLTAGIVLITTCLLASIAFSCFLIYRNRAQSSKKMTEDNNLSLSEEIVLRSFSYNELVKATDNFKEELGKGAFGTVYKGTLYNSNRTIAVKRLEKLVEEGEREFRAETRAIGRTHHRNLVRLLGFCDEGSSRLLVYEYMSNGSLANLLFRSQSRPDWKERVRIALDVARGIFYLHEDCEPHIIHCDIKPQNILMDGFWTAKISDFGLAKLLLPDQTRTFTGVRGTRGYLAPEWYRNIPISVKTDVYSYGIVLLEIICCRRYIELEVPDNEIVLTEWVYSWFMAGELHKLLGGEEVEGRILDRMVKVGLWCIQDEPALRPSMKNVILMMEGNVDIPIPPSPISSMNIS
ncbi:G-type lectin S-receptor-like serine/threonine-protein kinase LECRK3 [Magnolia sinica]|uniref:G-type lectin S-receptor-like serine/threonine-protein kinase LECRK3 n=1 Tax=Magnolia sinica TaxID=86752 RepID=UPI00265ADA67|nr:G-type lectin S-receptor-like serine/threonine-protein kinase LECRK3 [Magnolia sinica]XP_058099883.1 G-type lectin S-receptor-like serine/threonine-protein kinase LECRK3 [Magnolia sinica]